MALVKKTGLVQHVWIADFDNIVCFSIGPDLASRESFTFSASGANAGQRRAMANLLVAAHVAGVPVIYQRNTDDGSLAVTIGEPPPTVVIGGAT